MLKKITAIFLIVSFATTLTSCGIGSISTYQLISTIFCSTSKASMTKFSNIFDSEGMSVAQTVVGSSVPIETQIQKAKSLREYAEKFEASGKENDKYDPKWIDTVYFGYYPQSIKTVDTDDMIEWIVLDKNESKREALLLSKRVLDYIPYNIQSANVTWEVSTIRKWLNSDLYYFSFGRQDRRRIVQDEINNQMTNSVGPLGGKDTKDRVFLLSLDEANKYLKYVGLLSEGTVYIDTPGLSLDYWLRTPGHTQNFAAYVHRDGIVSNIGYYVNFSKGIRPAIRVKY